jgi:hypothetical protein
MSALLDPIWECVPNHDAWMREFVVLMLHHERMRSSWSEREKNLRALRARFGTDA